MNPYGSYQQQCEDHAAGLIDMDADGGRATTSEAIQEHARNLGDTENAWLLSDYDVWVANPNYRGAPVPHPEDYCGGCGDHVCTCE